MGTTEKRYVAAMLSGLVFPGAGQIYNGQPGKGAAYIIVTVVSIMVLVFVIVRGLFRALEFFEGTGGGIWDAVAAQLGASRGAIVLLVVILGLAWAAAVVDAFVVAREMEDRVGKGGYRS
jgi:TM2 domain-containing membrane protein YozV